MGNNLELIVKEEENYRLTRIGNKTFADKIIIKTEEKILKNYVYIDSFKVIA